MGDTHNAKTRTKRLTRTEAEIHAIAETIYRSATTRCACGSCGTWDSGRVICGTSGPSQRECIWAGCGNPSHTGQAISSPVWTEDYDAFFALPIERQREEVARAAAEAKHGRTAVQTGLRRSPNPAILAFLAGGRYSEVTMGDGIEVVSVR